jgi:hypothetical protein
LHCGRKPRRAIVLHDRGEGSHEGVLDSSRHLWESGADRL